MYCMEACLKNLVVDPGKRFLVLGKIPKELVRSTEMSHGCP